MSITESRNDEINVEEIMEKIRATILQRQAGGPLSQEEAISCQESASIKDYAAFSESLSNELYFINTNWAIHNNSYFISSHHPYIGPFLVKGRQLVHGEVRRYVDPVFARQTDFNANNVKILKSMLQMIHSMDDIILQQKNSLLHLQNDVLNKISQSSSDLISRIHVQEENLGQIQQELRNEYRSGLDSLSRVQEENLGQVQQELRNEYRSGLDSLSRVQEENLGQVQQEFNGKIITCVDKRISKVLSNVTNDIKNKAWLADLLENRIKSELITQASEKSRDISNSTGSEINYFIFEDLFRGPRDKIKQNQAMFLRYFEKCSHVLDIGCGRGEFLEMLKENDIGGVGIDSDSDMVKYCHSRNLDVVEDDAISYLEKLENKSLDGIFIGQLVEHLDPEYLVKMLNLCFMKMKYGCYIVIETVNPLSFISFVNFYLDLTHKKPLHPETMKFLLQSVCFREIEIKFFSFIPDESKLKKIEIFPELQDEQRRSIELYNYNIDMLNHVLWGPMDYALIGKK